MWYNGVHGGFDTHGDWFCLPLTLTPPQPTKLRNKRRIFRLSLPSGIRITKQETNCLMLPSQSSGVGWGTGRYGNWESDLMVLSIKRESGVRHGSWQLQLGLTRGAAVGVLLLGVRSAIMV